MESCIQFGMSAIRRRTTVDSVPAACRGLSRAQVNFAVASALHAETDTGPDKASDREQAIRLSPLLARLVTTVPGQPGPAPAPAPAPVAAASPAARLPLGMAALVSWLATTALGAWMMIGWIARGGLRRYRTRRAGMPRSLILGHFGLAVSGLLIWIGYLATGVTGVGWAAGAFLLPVAGLGMALISSGPAERPVTQQSARHPPGLVVAAHGVLAVLTILFALLAVTGAG